MIAKNESEMTCVNCKEEDCGWRGKIFKVKCISIPKHKTQDNSNSNSIFAVGKIYNVFCGQIYGDNETIMRATNTEDLNIETLNRVKTAKFELTK